MVENINKTIQESTRKFTKAKISKKLDLLHELKTKNRVHNGHEIQKTEKLPWFWKLQKMFIRKMTHFSPIVRQNKDRVQ